MRVVPTSIPDVLQIEPDVYRDRRGIFFESFNEARWAREFGSATRFVQDNHTESGAGVLRGLHYQIRQAQGKLVRVVRGEVFDVAVDLRRGSPHFGKWTGTALSEGTAGALWIPPGFAHGYLVLSERATVLYKTTDYYAPAHERCLLWNDPEVGVRWPLGGDPILSERDRRGLPLSSAETYP